MVVTIEVMFRFAENHSFTSVAVLWTCAAVLWIIQFMDNPSDPHLFTRDAWEANAEIWDTRMGDDGNDFFNMAC